MSINRVHMCVAVALTALVGADRAAASGNSCADNGTFIVCVKSASLTPVPLYGGNELASRASINLEITNKNEYPIDMLLYTYQHQLSLSPENAEAIFNNTSGGDWFKLSGIKGCTLERQCKVPEGGMTTFAPKMPMRIHVSFVGYTSKASLPLLQLAAKASFNGTFYVSERGRMSSVPIPIQDFPFANAYAR